MIFRVSSEIEFSHLFWVLMNVSSSDHKKQKQQIKRKIHTDQKQIKSFKQAHHTSDIYRMIP